MEQRFNYIKLTMPKISNSMHKIYVIVFETSKAVNEIVV